MSDEAKVDALMVPKSIVGGGDFRAKMIRLRAISAPLMGLAPGEPINVPWGDGGDAYYVRRGGHDNENGLLFPTSHERAGERRHEWADGPDGIKVGRLKDDPAATA